MGSDSAYGEPFYSSDKPVKNNIINLPVIDATEWTSAQQIKKISEEFGEVCEAIIDRHPVQIIRESLDAIQTYWTLINMVAGDYGLDLTMFHRQHVQKLVDKGYLKPEAGQP